MKCGKCLHRVVLVSLLSWPYVQSDESRTCQADGEACADLSNTLSIPSAVAVIPHWVPKDEKAKKVRRKLLRRTLSSISNLSGVHFSIFLVTNEREPGLDPLLTEQIVITKPQCMRNTHHHELCMPWEAVKALRFAATRGALRSCNLDTTAICGDLQFDYYMYIEDDLDINSSTFVFWRENVEGLYKRGYLLLPYRTETDGASLTDCFDVACMERTEALRDRASEEVYLRPDNPYAGCWFMTKEQFRDYTSGVEWSFALKDRERPSYMLGTERQVWGTREQAAGGLLWDPQLGPRRALTHLRLPVVHLAPPSGTASGRVRFHTIDEYRDKVDACVQGRAKCKALFAKERPFVSRSGG